MRVKVTEHYGKDRSLTFEREAVLIDGKYYEIGLELKGAVEIDPECQKPPNPRLALDKG